MGAVAHFGMAAEESEGLVQPAHLFQIHGQVLVGFGIVRLELDRHAILGFRLHERAAFAQGVAQGVVGVGGAWFETYGFGGGLFGFRHLAGLIKAGGEIDMRAGMAGGQANGRAKRGLGFFEPAQLMQQAAQAVMRLGLVVAEAIQACEVRPLPPA